jgi:hypothetical protein
MVVTVRGVVTPLSAPVAVTLQDGETGTLLTHPTRMRGSTELAEVRDASFTKRRARVARPLDIPH